MKNGAFDVGLETLQSGVKSMAIQYITGDATAPVISAPVVIAHICNDAGGWGKGFVKAVSRRWKDPEAEYRRWYGEEDFGLGKTQVVAVGPVLWVANMIAQHGMGRQDGVPPIRYDALEECLTAVAIVAKARRAEVHMPRIGCGLAGGSWSQVEPLIQKAMTPYGIRVTVYDLS
jgi:O-acetyl-ADP-ribose deacetylase (regulator of RNase III)